MNEYFTWQALATFSGSTSATAVITQFLKGYLPNIPTQIVSYVVALAVIALGTAATALGHVPWETWAIVPLNAIAVSLSANGAFAAVVRFRCGQDSDGQQD